jgi:hypothetical protein
LTIEKTHVPRGSSDEADDKYSTTKHEHDKQVQAVNTKYRLSPVNSSVSQTTNQFHGTSRNNCDLPILAEYSPDDVLVDSGDSYPSGHVSRFSASRFSVTGISFDVSVVFSGVRSGGSVYESPESTKTSSGEYSARIGKSQLFLLVPWNWFVVCDSLEFTGDKVK